MSRWGHLLKRFVAVATVLVAVAFGLVGVTSSGPSDSDSSAGIELVSGGGCTLRNGPSTLNQNCIYVTGTGLHVESVKGYIQAAGIWDPSTVCEITAGIWGTLQSNRERFFVSGQTDPGCSLISRGITATINKNFAPDSAVCSRTYWGATYGWSTPACITIRY